MARTFSFEEALRPRKEEKFSFEEAMGIKTEPTFLGVTAGQFAEAAVPEFDLVKRGVASAIQGTAGAPAGIEAAARAPVRKIMGEGLLEQSELYQLGRRLFGKEPTEEDLEKAKARKIEVDRSINQSIPLIPGLQELAEGGRNVSNFIRERQSPEALEAERGSRMQGNLLEAVTTGDFSKLSFGENPTLYGYALQGADVLGSLLPVVVAGALGPGSAAAVGGGMAAGEAAQNAKEFVKSKSDVELAAASPYYKDLITAGVPPEEAREIIANRAAEQAAFLQGSVAAVGGAATQKLISGSADKIINAAGRNRLMKIAVGGSLVGLEEGTQEFLEGIASDLGINAEVIKEIGEDSFANFVLGFIGGAPVGAVRGAITDQQPPGQPPGQAPPGQAQVPATSPTTPPGTQPASDVGLLPGMVEPEPELTPEDEAELQARIAGAPPPPAAPAAAVTPILPGPPSAPAGATIPTQEVTPVVGFETSLGSTYTLDEQGRSSRTKKSPGKGQGKTYAPHSVFYVTPEDSRGILDDKIGGNASIHLGYEVDGKLKPIRDITELPEGATPLVVVVDNDKNTARGVYRAKTKPEIGLAPVEKLYNKDGTANTHVGHPITKLIAPKPPATFEEQLQQTGTVAKQQLQSGETVSVQQPSVVEPSIEESLRAQKTEERRQRQADERARKGEFILQNRDRSTDPSIEQMMLIALDPDYARAGFSRTPDGAPVVSYGEFNPEQMGREDIVTTASGRKIPVQYAVVEADEVLSSNDLQGRPNLDYGNKEVIGTRAIAGNGRITGLREAFNRGNAGQYVQDMIGDSALHGVNPDVINSMQKPVLVRVMPEDRLTKDIGDDLNKSSMLELSPAEKARNDLNRVDLDGLDFKENGEISNESLNQFIQAQPVEERPTLLDNGLPTKQARQRLENAIFARAYNDKSLISMFAQADDVEARLVINALARVAPQMAKLEGAGDLDIRDIVTDAAKIIINGKRRGLKLTEIASQVDMTVDPDTRIIVDLFAQNPRSNKAAVEALTNAATIAYEESVKPAEGLFGAEPKMERRELIERMRRDYEPGRTEDVAQAQRPGPAPSDVEGAPEPSPPTVPPADQEFTLTGETEAEIRAKQAAIDERKKREREERLAAERKAQADAERDSFVLSGSDLPADEAIARGQRELTAAEPVETEAEKAKKSPFKIGERVVYNKPESKIFPDDPAAKIGATVDFIYSNNRVAIVRDDTGETDVVPTEDLSKPTDEEREAGVESSQKILDDLIEKVSLGTGKTNIQNPDATTIITEETWNGETTIKRAEFDAIVPLANKSDTRRGASYSVLVKDTPTEAIIFKFQPRGLRPLDRSVEITYGLSKTKLEKGVVPLEEAIEAELKKAGYDDLDKMSKQIKDEFGVSKPVADAYARAVQNARIQHVRAGYGASTPEQLMEALNTRDSLRKRIDGIVKRLEAAKPREGRPVEVQVWDVFYTGTTNLAAENVEAPSAQKAKQIATEKEGLKSIVRLTAKKKEKRIKTEAAPTEKGKFTLAKDGIVGFEIEPSRVPNGNDAFQYAVGRVEQDGTEGVFRRRADERGTYGGWRVETSVDKLIPEKSEPQKEEKKLTGAYLLAIRQQNAADRFIDSVMEQFGLTKDQAQNALNRLMKEKVVSLNPVDGQYKLKDGRFWDKEVMLRAAGVETEAKPEAPKVSESIGRAYQNASGMIYGKTWTNSLNNQHRARLGARLRDEGYTEREAKDIVEEAVKVQSDRRLPQMDFLQLRDLLIAGKTLGLEEVPSKKPEPKKEPEAPTITPGQQKNLDYWRENVAPAIRDYLTAYKNIGVERLERGFLKPKGISATEWLLKLRDQRSEFHRGRRVSFTGIQTLSKRDLWPTETGDGEVLRKAMLKAIQAINRAPGYNSDWIANMEAGSYDGIPGIEPRAKKEPPVGIVDESKIIDVEVREVSPIEQRLLTNQVSKLSDEEISTLESQYGDRAGTESFFNKLGQDIATYVNKGADFVAEKIRGIIAKLAKAVVAIAIVFNPTVQQSGFNFDLPDAYAKAKQITISLPLDVRSQMSPMAISVFTEMAATAQQSGKGFIIADKPNGMIHVFDKDGSVIAQDTALYGKDLGDVLMFDTAGGKKITPAGKYALEAVKLRDANTYAGGYTLDLVGTGDRTGTIAIHAAYLGNVNEKRLERLASPDVKDNRISYGCINTSHKTFLNKIIPNISKLDGGMVFVLPDSPESFVRADFSKLYNVEFDMPGDRQKDLFGSTSEAKQVATAMEVKGKKLPPGRSPELAAAARAVQAGTMSAEEYNKLVDVYKPIPVYAEPLKPATAEQVFDALDVKKREQINPQIPNGTKVGLRLDIPAFNRKGVFVVSIHQKRTASAPGKVIGYGSVAKAKNVTFGVGNQLKALEIAAGAAKDALQTIEGEYVNVSPEQAFAEAQRAIKDPSYVQVGIDPTRHAYFFDRRTTLPVVSAEEVIQIGNMVLAKNPTFGKKADFLYNIEGGPIAGDTQPDDMSFLDRLRKEESEKREIERQEKIAYYASIRRKEVALQQRVRDYGSNLETQRQLNNLNQIAQALKEDIDLDKPRVYTAENFMRQARAALDGVTPYKEQAISPDVFAVIQAIYMDDPRLLEGLRLSIKAEFSKKDEELRRAFGIRAAAGAFQPLERIVNLYTGTKGVTDPTVIRHELTHTLEQMMTGPQRMAIFNSYMDALKKAMRKNKDPKAQEFFDNVLKFLDKPTAKNKEAVSKTTPSYALYQFVNPSEYWAVNAEKLMAQRLGTSWDRFKKAVRKMFEKLKDIFGFNNQFAVHDVFDKIMSGSKERLGRDSIAAYIASSGEQFEFLNDIKEDSDLDAKYSRGNTPMLDVAPAKKIMLRTAQNAKESFKEMVENPSEILRMTFNPLVRGITYIRNKFIWFGTGLNEADRIRYNGQVKISELIATASLALDNMIRGGNIATQVLFQGGIEYNPKTLMFGAVKKEKNMTKVYEAEAVIRKKLGDQLGTNIIQGYLIAKRSKNIKDDLELRKDMFDTVTEALDLKVKESKALDNDPNATEKQKKAVNRELRSLFAEEKEIKKDYETIKKIAEDKVTMSDTEIEDFIARDKVHPELKEILDNFTSVNQNLLKFWRQVGLLSQPRYERLAGIKDYVPWYRIMADEEDVHSPLQATTRSATNIGKEKLFGPGKPSVVDDFVIEENQNVFKIQPAKVNAVKLNSKRLKPDEYEITPQGEMTLKVPYKPGDILVVQSERQIENIIDNMTRNVMRMTMNGLRQYAAQRIVSEYATRGADGKIMTFNKADSDRGRFDFINNGRRTVVEIQDPLIAEAALGMETVGMQMWKPLAAAANFTRRTITLSPVFQARQVFKDAPTAALVTGVKNPAALVGGVYKGFISALRDSDPASSILRSQGIGGFYSPARTPEADVKRQIGIINNSTYDYVIKALDHVGDSSDMAQRIAIYNRVMAETGDEALALYQAANVINFLRHGSGQVAQALVQTVPFLNAYAQSIDVLYNALIGGGLRGMDRKKAMQRLFVTGSLLAGTTILYAMLVGDDDDYMKMDDQSKIRNYMIPGTDVVLPMNTSAAFFFKAIPELIYNKVVNEGTENAIDEKRLRTALKEAAVDLLLGPTPIPSAVKPVVEISLNRDFFTSRPVVPAGLQDLDAYQQYDMRTSDAGKFLSALTGTEANRLLNPIEADHLIRGIFGTVGGMVAWSSNLIGTSADYRPEMGLKEMPITGAFLRPPVPRGREDLFYALKESTDRKYKTFDRLVDRDPAEAEAYLNRHPNLIAFYDYTSKMDVDLKEINAAIRFIGEIKDPSYTPEQKRKEILELMNLKQEILEGVEQFRKEAYAD